MSGLYHKIETLYERDEKTHKLVEPLVLKNRVYGLVDPWVWTEKIDGTNIRAIWHGGVVTFGGRTDNAQIPAGLVTWLNAHISADAFRATFPDHIDSGPGSIVLYGEGYGAGIQKGGGAYSKEKQFILFDVAVIDDTQHVWWLSDENMRDVASKIGLLAVACYGEMTLAEATRRVREGIPSDLAGGACQAEGLVGRPSVALFDKKGHRLIVKLKTADFAS